MLVVREIVTVFLFIVIFGNCSHLPNSFYENLENTVRECLANSTLVSPKEAQVPCDKAGQTAHNLDYRGDNDPSKHLAPLKFIELGERNDWPVMLPRIFDISPVIRNAFGPKVETSTIISPSSEASKEYYRNFYMLNASDVPRQMAIFQNVWVDRYGLVTEERQTGCRSVQLGKCPPCQRPFDKTKSQNHVFKPIVVSLASCYSGIWHFPMENLVALANINFTKYPFSEAVFHVPLKSPYILGWMQLAGIPANRITDVSVPARVLLAPEMGVCGHPLRPQIKWLIDSFKPHGGHGTSYAHSSTNPTLLYIERSGRRTVGNNNQVVMALTNFCKKHALKFQVHGDHNLPSLAKQIEIFSKVTFVVAPHGAGELFTAFMDRGGYVLEVSHDGNRAHHCYSRLSYHMGHSYTQIMALPGGNFNLSLATSVLEHYVADWRKQHGTPTHAYAAPAGKVAGGSAR
jgi:hypothetical protein